MSLDQTVRAAYMVRSLMLKSIIYALAHDTRSSLADIQFGIDLIQESIRNDDDSALPDALLLVDSGIRKQAMILADLQDWVSMEFTDPTCVDLNEVLQDLISTNEYDGTVTFGELPEVVCNRGAMRRAIDNLIRNGLDHNSKQERTVHVDWQKHPRKALTVRDNGDGFDVDHLQDLVMPFSQFGSTRSGFGLAIANNVFLAHGMDLTAESTVGEGTCFYVEMPDVKEQESVCSG